jgi:hypothetical protein
MKAVEPGELISCTVVNTRGSIWIQTCSRPSGESVCAYLDRLHYALLISVPSVYRRHERPTDELGLTFRISGHR